MADDDVRVKHAIKRPVPDGVYVRRAPSGRGMCLVLPDGYVFGPPIARAIAELLNATADEIDRDNPL